VNKEVQMAELSLPGGVRLQAPDPVAQQIAESLGPLLAAISNQLDMLIRLECGNLSRETLKERFDEFDAAAQLARSNGHGIEQ
jgi:hypothetical protein